MGQLFPMQDLLVLPLKSSLHQLKFLKERKSRHVIAFPLMEPDQSSSGVQADIIQTLIAKSTLFYQAPVFAPCLFDNKQTAVLSSTKTHDTIHNFNTKSIVTRLLKMSISI